MYVNAPNSSRNLYAANGATGSQNIKDKGPSGAVSLGRTPTKTNVPCWRLNGDHTWRKRHVDWAQTLQFGNASFGWPIAPPSNAKTVANVALAIRNDSGNVDKKGSKEEHPDLRKSTEEERVNRYNLHVSDTCMAVDFENFEQILDARRANSPTAQDQQIVLDSGATSSAVGKDRIDLF